MKIALCCPQVPFVYGGAEKHIEMIYQELLKRKFEVELIRIPFKWYPPLKILDSVLSWKLLDLTESDAKKIDLIIATKFPSWVVDHPNVVAWIFHQHRQAYDLQNTEFDDLRFNEHGEFVRKKIIEIDNRYLRKAKKIFTNSKNTSNRLLKFNNIQSEHLYVPVPNASRFHNKEYGNYILYPSRISPLKRQDLLVDAMKYVKSDIKCIIAGYPDHKKWLEDKIRDSGIGDKIEFLTDLSDDEMVDLYSKALAVVYIPQDEDFGFVTQEAFNSEKPILTATDSGGPLEFIQDGVNGIIVEPKAEKIAIKIDELAKNLVQTKKMGKAGKETIKNLNLNWDTIIKKLTS